MKINQFYAFIKFICRNPFSSSFFQKYEKNYSQLMQCTLIYCKKNALLIKKALLMMVCNAFISGLLEINLFCFFSYSVYPPFSLTLHIDGHKNFQFDTAYQDYVNLFLSCLIFHKKSFQLVGFVGFCIIKANMAKFVRLENIFYFLNVLILLFGGHSLPSIMGPKLDREKILIFIMDKITLYDQINSTQPL